MTGQPSTFSRSVEQIADDFGSVARSWSEESRLVRDEAMGAELLLTREFIEQIGICLETADRLNDLAIRQTGHLIRDYVATLRHVATEPGLHNVREIVLSHWQRRLEHLAEGSDEFAGLVRSETRKVADALFGMWRPFATVLGRDWSKRPGSAHPQ
jgi:hypothetical protein